MAVVCVLILHLKLTQHTYNGIATATHTQHFTILHVNWQYSPKTRYWSGIHYFS